MIKLQICKQTSLLGFASMAFAAAPQLLLADEPTLAEGHVITVSAVQQREEPAEPRSVVVATDEADQSAARAVAQELLQLQEEQGGSIVPPATGWLAPPTDPPRTSNAAPAPQLKPSPSAQSVLDYGQHSPTREGHPGWDGRNVWAPRYPQNEPHPHAWPAIQAAWNAPHPQQRPSPADLLRDSAWQLETTAQRLEIEEFYEQADSVREAAQHLRMEARKQSARDKSETDQPQGAKHQTQKEKKQKPHNRDKSIVK